MTTPAALIGSGIDEIDTPALLLDLDSMERNVARMAAAFRGLTAKLRPHAKTHKTPVIAHKQLAAGAIGITCAKLGEAEVMVEGGVRDILIANQIVGARKIARLVSLARHADLIVAVDDAHNVQELSQAARAAGVLLRVLVEVDVGMHRCGVAPGEPALVLAQQIERAAELRFAGLMGYEGHLVFVPSLEERVHRVHSDMQTLIDTVSFLESHGLPVDIVSAGGTGTAMITGRLPRISEIQAGSYVFMDGRYKTIEGVDFDCALSLLTTVISRPRPERVIIDAGMKTLTHEFGLPRFKAREDLELLGLSEEHGTVQLKDPAIALKLGDKLEIIPSHGDTTLNIHDFYYGLRRGRVEVIWPIAARGKSR
jgi:D-serine deaminase-like pyridoxal phosphate-dependent protein